jgi:hypothetical protein
MALYTLSDARAEVSEVIVPGGSCATGGFVDKRINSALRRLMISHDAPETMAILKVTTDKPYITIPRGLQTPRAINVCNVPAPLHHHSYSFAPAGPGECYNMAAPITLEMQPGYVHTAFDTTANTRLVAFTTSLADQTKSISIYGVKPNGEDIVGGFDIPIRRWKDGIEGEIEATGIDFSVTFSSEASRPEVGQITGITLPHGLTSYVTLMAINPDTWESYFLSKYHPEETKPGYRRFKIRNLDQCPCTPEKSREFTLLAKQEFIPLTRDDDILPIQSLDAIKFMVMSLAEENLRNPQTATLYTQRALSMLNAYSRNQTDGQQMVVNVKDDFGISHAGNLFWG